MREWFEIGWDRGRWRVRSAKAGGVLLVVRALGREHFTGVEVKEAPPPESPAAAATGDETTSAEARIPGTAVVRRDGDSILIETPRRSAKFAHAIRPKGGDWDSEAHCWYAPVSFVDEVEAMVRRCYEKIEIRTE